MRAVEKTIVEIYHPTESYACSTVFPAERAALEF